MVGVGGGSEEQPDESLDWTGKCMDEVGRSTLQCIVSTSSITVHWEEWVDCTFSGSYIASCCGISSGLYIEWMVHFVN